MPESKPRSPLLQFVLIFALTYLLINSAMRFFYPERFADRRGNGGAVTLEMVDATVKSGNETIAIVRNGTDESFTLVARCPMAPFDIARKGADGEYVSFTATETALPCPSDQEVAAHDSLQVPLAPWKYSLLSEFGAYQIQIPDTDISTEFRVYEAGVITQMFRSFITKPLLNFLIFIASLLPNYSLGWAIIILTLIIKIILFFPTQHALEGQKKLQAVQPKIDALRKKFKNDPQRLNQETLALWKKEKINPMQSCMPMLLQFPVLIGLFFVIRDGSNLSLSRHLIYDTYQDLPWTFGTDFLGMDLLVPSLFIFPPLLFALQFLQMKLSFAIAKKKTAKKEDKKGEVIEMDGKKPKKEKSDQESMQEVQQKVMLWGLPIMIAVFAVQFPAAVSLYWGVSTVFAIGQQVVVNRKHL